MVRKSILSNRTCIKSSVRSKIDPKNHSVQQDRYVRKLIRKTIPSTAIKSAVGSKIDQKKKAFRPTGHVQNLPWVRNLIKKKKKKIIPSNKTGKISSVGSKIDQQNYFVQHDR